MNNNVIKTLFGLPIPIILILLGVAMLDGEIKIIEIEDEVVDTGKKECDA
ncbi:hypothetical protein JGI3_00011 [Candidatus Kryptobacter tengchongensis]|nr:hypothetical protein JGI3_00011 [Candidatus Kryptobacter tengchongensis]